MGTKFSRAVLDILVSRVNLDLQDSQGFTILSHHCRRTTEDSLYIINKLIDSGANPDIQTRSGKTALMFALENYCPNDTLDKLIAVSPLMLVKFKSDP